MERKQIIENLIFNKLAKEDRSSNIQLFNGILDSLGLVNLLVDLEYDINDMFNITIVIASDRTMSCKHSPFSTVQTLTDFIDMLVEEKINE